MVHTYIIHPYSIVLKQSSCAYTLRGLTNRSEILIDRKDRMYNVPIYKCNDLFFFECRG